MLLPSTTLNSYGHFSLITSSIVSRRAFGPACVYFFVLTFEFGRLNTAWPVYRHRKLLKPWLSGRTYEVRPLGPSEGLLRGRVAWGQIIRSRRTDPAYQLGLGEPLT